MSRVPVPARTVSGLAMTRLPGTFAPEIGSDY
jgi:hypothetical protein